MASKKESKPLFRERGLEEESLAVDSSIKEFSAPCKDEEVRGPVATTITPSRGMHVTSSRTISTCGCPSRIAVIAEEKA
jgi:hypothetical protein